MRALFAPLAAAALTLVAAPASAQLAPPNDAGVTWGHIHLTVEDVGLHERIWTEHFGGNAVQKGPLHTVRLPSTVMIFTEREPTGPSRGSGVDHFGFSVPDLAAFLERWQADGFEVEAEFEGYGGRPQAYITVPDGIRVELQEIPDLDVPAEPYHVHIYTRGDVEELRDWYVDLFSMTPRVRGSIPVTADVPGMNVSFGAAEGEVSGTRGRAVDHIGFEVDDLKAFTDRLTALGIEFDVAYREIDSIELAIAFFTDPSGVYIELTEGLDRY
ncbi:MAG: VOC family protein [Gemmatimonadetes bacterium]|nr:VOC family protein [Gemmatimonadota bacterium]